MWWTSHERQRSAEAAATVGRIPGDVRVARRPLASRFSDDFSGFTGGGDFLVRDRERWAAITRQDFAQVKDALRIELKDVSIQSLAETIAVAAAFFTIHLPIPDLRSAS